MAKAQSSFNYEYSFKTQRWSPIVAQKVHTLTEVPIIKTIDLSLVVGADGRLNGPATFGGMISRTVPVAKEASLLIGLTGRITSGRPPQIGGLVIGVSFNL